MLEKLLKLNLQLFGEGGGDGGDGGSASATGESAVDNSGEDKILASIPEKARGIYQKAQAKSAKSQKPTEETKTQPTTENKPTTEKLSYADLIKSDDYKEEHKAYMDKTIAERFKKYRGLEEEYGKAKATLDIVASKYGIKSDDENFLEVLNHEIEADNSYYEEYAMTHDVSTDEARRVVTMERKVAQMEAEKKEQEQQEQMRQHMLTLQQNAEKTKARFPQFDLETEMQDERFRRLCAVSNGDTTSAYMACHWNEILPATVQMATQQAQMQTAQAVASNKARPIENGMSSTSPSVAENNFKGMNLTEIRAYADEQRRKKGR